MNKLLHFAEELAGASLRATRALRDVFFGSQAR
jgi:hypothetical protein